MVSNMEPQQKRADDTEQLDSFAAGERTRETDVQEWWLWGYAITVTLVLTVAVICLAIPASYFLNDEFFAFRMKEWIRGLAALVLLFDLYTIYQHLRIRRIRRLLKGRDRIFHLIAENAADMIAVVDREGKRLYNSPVYEKTLGYTPEELALTSSLEQVHPDDRARVTEAAEKAYQSGCGERLEYRIRHKNGSWRTFESTANAFRREDGEIDGLVIINRDITERKQAKAMLEHHALYDDLTGLPNRCLFIDRLERSISVSQRHTDFKFAVLFIDIDGFKLFNDSMGHEAGDLLLIHVARRLAGTVRNVDSVSRPPAQNNGEATTVARPGGDEFVMLCEELRGPSDAIRIAERIQKRLAEPLRLGMQEVVLSASIGIAFNPATGEANASDMLRDAEIAMYRAKRAGKSRCEVFDKGMHIDAVQRLHMETQLREALELGELQVHYQPLVDLEDARIVGFEALSRWQHGDRVIMPGEFIKVADETGLIMNINQALMLEGCKAVRRWNAIGSSGSPLRISANITAKQFAQPDLANRIEAIFKETGVDPLCVDLEITEDIAMADADRSVVVFSELKALGVRLSIDDFGTGYSSLSRLQRFPVDILKIDRSFIMNIDQNSETLKIVEIIIMLAHTLGLEVVAEGIETTAQAGILKELGCDLGQGYLFGRPENASSAEKLLVQQMARKSRKAFAASH